jgi:hypothetical protein
MKANNVLFSARLSVLLGAFVALCVVAIPASAKPLFKGTFTLTHEVRWGKTTLPAGQYSLEMNPSEHTLLISNARTNKPVALEMGRIDDNARNQDSKLLIAVEGNQRIVCSARIAGFGEVFHSTPDFARATTEEAIITQRSPSAAK